MAILQLALPTDSTWAIFGLGTQALIVGAALTVGANFLQKVSFVAKQFISFAIDRKQRTYLFLNIIILVGTILFLPLVLAIILASSILSAPLLPLFTLPIFFVSFPRPRRFWPSLIDYGSSYSKCNDSIYYQQAEAEIARVLSTSISSGTVYAHPGSHFILRFQDRLGFATILETGYGFCTLTIRGLELQETSCHTVEASTVDDMFELAFDAESNDSCLQFWLITHILNTLHPVDSATIHTYSDARNVLTGIIDNPQALEMFSTNLLKTLVWVLFHYLYSSGELCAVKERHLDSGLTESISKAPPFQPRDNEVCLSSLKPKICINADTLSWSDSISSTIGDLYLASSHSPAHATSLELPGQIPEDRSIEPPHLTALSETTLDDETVQPAVRLSAVETCLVQRRGSKNGSSNKVHPENGKQKGSLPAKWMQLPFGYSQINKLLKDFPKDWLQFIKGTTPNSCNPDTEHHFMRLVMVCFGIVDIPASNQLSGKVSQTEPFNIYEGFHGEHPYSPNINWLIEDELLHTLVTKAYRHEMLHNAHMVTPISGVSNLFLIGML